MAHLIELTDANTQTKMLFNLDTVVSIERGQRSTIITTRWGRTNVQESLSSIKTQADREKADAASVY